MGRDGSESDIGSENGRGDSNKTRTEGSGKISYASRDSEYMDAISSDNMTAAERMVREAAKEIPTIAKDKRGFPLHLYHGTPEFGFTEFVDKKHKVPFIYTSTKSQVSAHYLE